MEGRAGTYDSITLVQTEISLKYFNFKKLRADTHDADFDDLLTFSSGVAMRLSEMCSTVFGWIAVKFGADIYILSFSLFIWIHHQI